MKKFTLMLVAGLFALAGSVQAQKKVVLSADDITIAKGENAELVIKMDYETTEEIGGTNFSLSFPDGLVLSGFSSKDEMLAAKASALKKQCSLGDDGIWGEDANAGWLSVKAKADGGLLFVLIDQDDQTPFVSTKAKVVTLNVTALEDVSGTGKIYAVGVTNTSSKSLDLGNIDDYEYGVNLASGINGIKAADATAPAYNLQGVRVNSAAKGVIIRDGKKMVVK